MYIYNLLAKYLKMAGYLNGLRTITEPF